MWIEQMNTKQPKPLAVNCAAVSLSNLNRNGIIKGNEGAGRNIHREQNLPAVTSTASWMEPLALIEMSP